MEGLSNREEKVYWTTIELHSISRDENKIVPNFLNVHISVVMKVVQDCRQVHWLLNDAQICYETNVKCLKAKKALVQSLSSGQTWTTGAWKNFLVSSFMIRWMAQIITLLKVTFYKQG